MYCLCFILSEHHSLRPFSYVHLTQINCRVSPRRECAKVHPAGALPSTWRQHSSDLSDPRTRTPCRIRPSLSQNIGLNATFFPVVMCLPSSGFQPFLGLRLCMACLYSGVSGKLSKYPCSVCGPTICGLEDKRATPLCTDISSHFENWLGSVFSKGTDLVGGRCRGRGWLLEVVWILCEDKL